MLRHSAHHLDHIFPQLRSMTVEEIAEHADGVCKRSVNSDWIRDWIKSLVNLKQNENTTSLGNVAYIATFCVNDETRLHALKLIDDWKFS